MKKQILSILALAVLVTVISMSTAAGLSAREMKEIDKTFPSCQRLRIKTVLGNCIIDKSDDGQIHINVRYDYDDDEFEAKFRERKNRLDVEEDIDCNNCNNRRSIWTVLVPAGVDIRFNSATGSLEVESMDLELDGNSGTGRFVVENCTGEFDLNSGTGDIVVRGGNGEFELSSGTGDVDITGSKGGFRASSGTGDVSVEGTSFLFESDLSSGTGRSRVTLIESPKDDISISSGTGRAILEMDGNEPDGYFEMIAMKRKGRIDSSFDFDGEEEFERNGEWHVRKFFARGESDVTITIKTGTGKAVLDK